MSEWSDVVRLKERKTLTDGYVTPKDLNFCNAIAADNSPLNCSIPGYHILEEIGRGGMGVVYKARQLNLNRLVALKVIIGGTFAGDVDRARFRMEAEAVARLTHKHIVQVYDVGKAAGIEYIAFEYIEGPTLRRWQNGRPTDPHATARIVSVVARAVQHAHDRGIVHRDLKPANILLAGVTGSENRQEPDGLPTVPDSRQPVQMPKVMDFGLAKVIEGGKDITVSGIACGTPNYMAPEQVRGGPAASKPAVDVWGLGAILFELLTGRPPFVGKDAATIMQDIVLNEPPSVRKLVKRVPRDLATIVSKCLEKDLTRRYLCPGDLADDLDRFLSGQPIRARSTGPLVRARRWVLRNPLASAFGCVLTGCLAAVSFLAAELKQLADREQQATDRERSAREVEAGLRKEAEEATRKARAANEETTKALASVEEAYEKIQSERDRAEKNLDLARKAVSNVLSTLSTHNEGQNPSLVPVYQELLTGFEPFVSQLLSQKNGDRGLRFDQALIARGRGIMAATSGRLTPAKEHLVLAVERFRELVRDDPEDLDAQRELGETLACLGSTCLELGQPDGAALLREALEAIDRLLADNPDDVRALHSKIRVLFALPPAEGRPSTEQNSRTVLTLVERLTQLEPPNAQIPLLRAHALNNIASELTNGGKTAEAEQYWKDVLAIRENLARVLPNDKIIRYELAKCLLNYSNHAARTNRKDQALQFRERAASLFDTLNEDAAFRTTYISVMIRNDQLLVADYRERGQREKAIARLSNILSLNAILLERDKTITRLRADQADTHTRRAELWEQGGKHAEAARDYRAAAEYSTHPNHRDYCSARHVQALVRAGELNKAAEEAGKLKPDDLSHPFPCIELARGWLMIAAQRKKTSDLKDEELKKAVDDALEGAKNAVRAAEKKNWFKEPAHVREFHSQRDFEPLWDMIPRIPE